VAAVGGEGSRAPGAPFYSRATAMASDGRWGGGYRRCGGLGCATARVLDCLSWCGDGHERDFEFRRSKGGRGGVPDRGATTATSTWHSFSWGAGRSAPDRGRGAHPCVHSYELMIVR
jgi:hypothetical protein